MSTGVSRSSPRPGSARRANLLALVSRSPGPEHRIPIVNPGSEPQEKQSGDQKA
jgi:hypothetical protein